MTPSPDRVGCGAGDGASFQLLPGPDQPLPAWQTPGDVRGRRDRRLAAHNYYSLLFIIVLSWALRGGRGELLPAPSRVDNLTPTPLIRK